MQTLQNQFSNNNIGQMLAAKKISRLALAGLFLAAAGGVAKPAFATSAPSAPNIADASDSGLSFTDNITNVSQPTFTGTGTPFNIVTLYAGATAIGSVIVPPSGQWNIPSNTKLGDGPWTMTAKQTVGGVVSAASSPLKITIDTVIPYLSTPDLTPGTDTGTSYADNLTNNQNPTFQGTASPGASILLFNTTLSTNYTAGSALVTAQGNWSSTVSKLPAGSHTYLFAAQAVDVAGNKSAMSGSLSVGIDTNIPANPSIPDLTTDSGVSSTDNITNINTPSFALKAEKYAKVELWRISDAPYLIGTANMDSSGNGTVTAPQPIPDGYYNCYTKAYDKAGNQADHVSGDLLIQIDTTAPPAAWKPALDPASNSASPYDTITNVTTPVVGSSYYDGNPFDTPPILTIDYFAGVFHYTKKAPVEANGYTWSIVSPELPSGVYDVTATTTDEAGNSATSPALSLTIDNYPPAVNLAAPASGASIYKLNSIGGTISDFTSGNDEVIYLLTRDSDGLYWNGTAWGQGFAPQQTILSGNDWANSAGLPQGANLPLGSYTLTIAGSDKAGNSKTVTSTFTVIVPETVKPVAVIDTPTANQKLLISDFKSGAVTGSASDNVAVESVKIRLSRKRNNVNTYWNGDDFVTASSTVDADVTGSNNATWNWVNQLPAADQLDSGLYQVDVYAIDTAGSKSATVSRPFTLGTDFTAPDVLIATPTNNQSLIISAFKAGALTGTASDNLGVASVKVKLYRKRGTVTTYWDGSNFVAASSTVDAAVTTVGDMNVTWNLTQVPSAATLDAGVYSVIATAYDAAGNSKASVVRNFTLTSNIAPILGGSGGSS